MKDYKRITFYLCTTEDISCYDRLSSDDEDVSIVVTKKRNFPTFLMIVLTSLMKTTGALQVVQRGFRLFMPEFQRR